MYDWVSEGTDNLKSLCLPFKPELALNVKKKKRVIALINVNEQGTPSYFSYSCYFPILTNH